MYLRELDEKCRDCSRRASVELMNSQNGSLGKYCRKHGKSRMKYIEKLSKPK